MPWLAPPLSPVFDLPPRSRFAWCQLVPSFAFWKKGTTFFHICLCCEPPRLSGRESQFEIATFPAFLDFRVIIPHFSAYKLPFRGDELEKNGPRQPLRTDMLCLHAEKNATGRRSLLFRESREAPNAGKGLPLVTLSLSCPLAGTLAK